MTSPSTHSAQVFSSAQSRKASKDTIPAGGVLRLGPDITTWSTVCRLSMLPRCPIAPLTHQPASQIQLQMQDLQLLRSHRRRGVSHQVGGALALGEGDYLADVGLAGQQHGE